MKYIGFTQNFFLQINPSEIKAEGRAKNQHQKSENSSIPRCVELDDDEVVLADSVREVEVIQSEHKFFAFRFIGRDRCDER